VLSVPTAIPPGCDIHSPHSSTRFSTSFTSGPIAAKRVGNVSLQGSVGKLTSRVGELRRVLSAGDPQNRESIGLRSLEVPPTEIENSCVATGVFLVNKLPPLVTRSASGLLARSRSRADPLIKFSPTNGWESGSVRSETLPPRGHSEGCPPRLGCSPAASTARGRCLPNPSDVFFLATPKLSHYPKSPPSRKAADGG